MQELRQSTEVKVRIGSAVDATDGVTPETGLTLGAADQAELLKHNGAATVDISASTFAAVTAVDGWYDLTLTAGNTDTLGQITVVIQDSSLMVPIFRDFMVVTANYWDSKYSTDTRQVDVTQIGGVAQSATDLKDMVDTGYDPATHKIQSDLIYIHGTALTETDGQLAAAFKKLFDVATPLLVASTVMRGTDGAATPAEVATALANIHLDHLLAVDYDPASKPGVATALLNELVENDGGVSRYTANALEQAPSGGTNPNVLIDTTIAAVTDQTHFTLTAGSNDDDAYKDQAFVVYDASDSDYPSIRVCSAYTGATKTVTLDAAPDFTIVGGDGARAFVTAPGTTAPTVGQIRAEMEGAGYYLDLIKADTDELQTDWTNGGRLDLILDIIAADTTTDIPALIATAQADLDTITGADGVTLATAQALYAPNKVVPDAAGVAPTAAEIKTAIEAAGSHLALILADTGTDGVLIAPTATSAQLVDDVWDEILSGATHNIAGSAGRRVREIGAYAIESGTAQAGNSHSITLSATASAVDGTYNRNLIILVDNTGVGQTRTIVDYDGTTKVAIIDRDWRTSPDATTTYQITPDNTPLVVDQGVAQAGTATTITLRAYASSVNDVYLCNVVAIIAGTGRGQARLIGAYNGTTKVATICGDNWITTPDATSVYVLMPYGTTCTSCIGTHALGLINAECDTANADYGANTTVPDAAGTAATPAEVATAVTNALTVDTIADSYATDGAQPTIAQAMLAIQQMLQEKSITGTTLTVKKPDGSTVAMTFTLDSATAPTSITRAT